MAKTAKAVFTPQRNLQKDLAAAQVLKEQLKDILPEEGLDAATLHDMIEGETSLLETVEKVVGQIGMDEAAVAGITRYKTTLDARKSRLEARAELLRAMVLNVLDLLEEKRLDLPIATVVAKQTQQKLVLTEESDVPARFWKTPDPVLSRKDLIDALKAGEQVKGATLDNGGVTVQITFG